MLNLDAVRREVGAERRDGRAAAANAGARGGIGCVDADGGADAGVGDHDVVGDELRQHVAPEGHEGVARARHHQGPVRRRNGP